MMRQARDLMTRRPEIVDQTTTLQQAARIMAALDLGMLLVGTPAFVTGVITDRDLVVRGIASGFDPQVTMVEALIDHPAVTCRETDSIQDVLAIMGEFRIRRLLVVDEFDLPVGVISIDDIAANGEDEQMIAQALQRIVTPAQVSA